ncbi:S-layer homology domain-containing protein [Cohnella thailandensis]|uniref:S-layer homology domain-containing protein n=1 Tax=Cohnella thailandensis TaxID=557557 RepID=A0A841SQQ9_9BACL|nr:S-layer homology domain-containing protein [Cohnella thailandensis]
MELATNAGIAKGYPDGTFRPNARTTSAEAN